MSTAADELRAAAEHLRSLIAFLGDNRGPWKVGTPPSGYPQSISNVGVPYCVADTHEDPSIPTFTIAPYIAAMHPGVGKALARWLDEEADRRDAHLAAAIQIWGNAEHPDAAAWLATGLGKGSAPALDLARQINTGSQT